MGLVDTADFLGISLDTYIKIETAGAAITKKMADECERILGVSALVLMSIQENYDRRKKEIVDRAIGG